ncbi:MAG: hypothetical protein IIB61_05645, partial [Planctomycetes bacterium]|nr:hypothetical protein [Planctomycetota bacterium]
YGGYKSYDIQAVAVAYDWLFDDLNFLDVRDLWDSSGETEYGYTEPCERADEMIDDGIMDVGVFGPPPPTPTPVVHVVASGESLLEIAANYGVSANRWRIWDLEHPRKVLGWSPLDDAAEMWDQL